MRFFRTPKGLLLILLAIFTVLATPAEGVDHVLPAIVASMLLAGTLDLLILRWRSGRWTFPSGAILTALIVAMVLSSREPWAVVACTAVIGVVSKYIVRSKHANVFNPAAVGLVATYYLFDTGESWWGALPELPMIGLAALIVGGVFIADRVKKLPLVLAFLGGYYGLFTLMAFMGTPESVAEVFRSPDLNAALYFAFIILTDPPTSPTKAREQILCGVIVAVASVLVFQFVGAVYYLLAGVLVGNVWEAWRRVLTRRRRAAPLVVAEIPASR